VLKTKLLRVVNTRLLVGITVIVPRFCVVRVDFGCFSAIADNLLVVLSDFRVFKLVDHRALIRLQRFYLPRAQLDVASGQQSRFDVGVLFNEFLELEGGLLLVL